MIDQSTDTTKLQLGEPMNFLRITFRNIGEREREVITGANMTQRQLPHESPPQDRWQFTKPGTGSTLHNLNRLKSALSSWPSSGSEPLSGSSTGLFLFLLGSMAGLLSRFLGCYLFTPGSWACLKGTACLVWVTCVLHLYTLEKRGLVNLISFRDVPKLF